MSGTSAATWDDYQRFRTDLRTEYIDGSIVTHPAPRRAHQNAVWQLVKALRQAAGPSAVVIEGWGWKPGTDEFVPDLLVTPPTDKDVRYTGIPHLAVEVLSSNPARDTVTKSGKYAQAGLPRYWVVDPDTPSVVAYELRDGIYHEVATVEGDDTATFDFGPATVTLRPTDLLA